jgi:hypothetical protein
VRLVGEEGQRYREFVSTHNPGSDRQKSTKVSSLVGRGVEEGWSSVSESTDDGSQPAVAGALHECGHLLCELARVSDLQSMADEVGEAEAKETAEEGPQSEGSEGLTGGAATLSRGDGWRRSMLLRRIVGVIHF